MRRIAALVVVAVVATAPGLVGASVDRWRLSEVLRAGAGPGDGDGAIRFIELYTVDGGCWFPSTEVALYDGAGAVIGAVAPFVETTCLAAGTYLLLATPAAEAAFAVTADRPLIPAIPASARQACLRSTGTIYDCVRWGAVSVPVHDLFGPDDDTAALAPPPGLALARIADLDVIADDWIVADPTPGGPNDGTPWIPPDAGADAGADAGPGPDAGPSPDAGPRPDANVDAAPRPDARDDRFLDLDPVGGAGCGCQGGTGAGSTALVALLSLSVAAARRRRPG